MALPYAEPCSGKASSPISGTKRQPPSERCRTRPPRFVTDQQLLPLAIPDRDDEPATLGELRDQPRRHRGRGGGHEDRVERRLAGRAQPLAGGQAAHVVQPQLREPPLCGEP